MTQHHRVVASIVLKPTSTKQPPAADPSDKRRELDEASERELIKIYYDSVFDVIKDNRNRTLEAAKYVQVAAGAVGTIYTGTLALVFSASDKPLPIRGLLTPIFLGLAIALSATYLGFIQQRPARVTQPRATSSKPERQIRRANHFAEFVGVSVRRTSWAMRSAVLALGIGLAFLPAPFVTGEPPLASAAAAPSIPEALPNAIEAKATAVFNRQADAYLAEVQQSVDPPHCERGLPELIRRCGWQGQDDVNDRFREMVLGALILVALPPVISLIEYLFGGPFTRRLRDIRDLSRRKTKLQNCVDQLTDELERLKQP